MNDNELNAQELIHKLSHAGEYPHPDLISAIYEQRAETEPLLLALFVESYDDHWPDGDPRWFRFIHAGKFMIAWKNLDALPTFVRLYSSDDAGMLDICEWFEEDLFHFGPAAIPHLKPVISKDSGNEWHYGKGLSGSILTKIAAYYPETREEVAAIFRAQLPPQESIPSLTDTDEMLGNWASELGTLADEASRGHILALDDADLFSPYFFKRPYYLRDMNRGHKPKKPPAPYDIQADYQRRYEWEQTRQKRLAREREQQHRHRVRAAQPRTEPTVGRNAPCPCGSGKKYKQCHGRPGV